MISSGSSVSSSARSSSGVAEATLPAVCAARAASSSRRVRAPPVGLSRAARSSRASAVTWLLRAAALRAAAVELGGDLLVGAGGGRGEVEGAALHGSRARAAPVHGGERAVRRALPAGGPSSTRRAGPGRSAGAAATTAAAALLRSPTTWR